MKYIFKFFGMIWEWITNLFSWVVTVPALVIGAVCGLVSSVQSFFSTLFVDASTVNGLVDLTEDSIVRFAAYLENMPDIVKIALYSLSFDVFVDYVLHTYGVFITCVVALVAFLVKGVVAYLLVFFSLKYAAKLVSAFIPVGYCPTIITRISNSQLVPVGAVIDLIHPPV